MNLSEENKDKLQKELLTLKLKENHTVEEKYRIQTLQQILFGNR